MDKINVARKFLLKFLSAFMAVLMVYGVIGSLSILPVYAAEGDEEVKEIIDYQNFVFNTPEEKLATMDLRADAFGYELYYESYSGEIAYRDKASGQTMFSNPYDIGAALGTVGAAGSIGSADTRNQLLSQIIIKYTDNDQEKTYSSFNEAATRNQIHSKNVKNGVRVEYTIGKEETRNLVPQLIEKSRFDEQILSWIEDEQALKKLNAFYTLKDPNDPKLTVRGVMELQATFPITNSMAVYVFDPYASAREITLIESYIKLYCQHYTFAELDSDHMMTQYEGAATAPALFKMALEYYLNEDGLQVRLPANGIRFDESTYQLNNIQILPYMGAGSYDNSGYTFIPDGSGTIMRFEDFKGNPVNISSKIYGQDQIYYEISGGHQQNMRFPVYGVVENYSHTYAYEEEVEVTKEETDDEGNVTTTTELVMEPREGVVDEDRGYLAIVTEGDSLASIMASHGGALHKYCTVYTQFNPRPKDSYNLAENMSVGANAMWTVVSKRKYTGSYRIQYIMLTDADVAKAKGINDYYEVDWTGMAKAYRDYLIKNEVLTPIADTKEDIPLYVESFGAIQTTESILSIPVEVMTPLTTFDNLKLMYEQLEQEGIDNIVFKLTGFANKGVGYTEHAPTKVKFEKNVGGNKGYSEFLDYADLKGIGVYPEFDFAYTYSYNNDLSVGFSTRQYGAKTIDNRYTRRQIYDYEWQSFFTDFKMLVSPSVYGKIYDKFMNHIGKLGVNGLSVSTLGTALNSDFDKKDPYNREDSKEFTIEILERMAMDHGNIMIDGGNAYALKYAAHIMNVALDSSRYYYSSQSVPFMGMVLHGYIPFTGTPTNMAGDINVEILKIIENGSAPYFTLSYQNTEKLKDYFHLAQYYAISYEIWFNDLIEKYGLLNENLKDLQTATIEDHEFIAAAERVPSAAELAADKAEADALAAEEAEALALKEAKAELKAQRDALKAAAAGIETDETTVTEEVAEEIVEEEVVEETVAEDPGYVANKYTCALGTVVKVTYSNGVSFLLNYNSFAVTAEGKTIDALGFIRIG